jgi:hypothetical protein
MPAWCAYRDAARKENLAHEAEAAAEGIAAMRPQAPQFQNAPPAEDHAIFTLVDYSPLKGETAFLQSRREAMFWTSTALRREGRCHFVKPRSTEV